jgi:addiction module HigA family antidote
MNKYELKRTPTHPGEILNEKRSIIPDMALRLARYFGTTPDIWIGLQADYDLYRAKMKSKKTIDEIKPFQGNRVA